MALADLLEGRVSSPNNNDTAQTANEGNDDNSAPTPLTPETADVDADAASGGTPEGSAGPPSPSGASAAAADKKKKKKKKKKKTNNQTTSEQSPPESPTQSTTRLGGLAALAMASGGGLKVVKGPDFQGYLGRLLPNKPDYKRMWFELRGASLSFAPAPKEKAKGTINLVESCIRNDVENALGFVIHTPSGMHFVQADTLDEKRSWKKRLIDAVSVFSPKSPAGTQAIGHDYDDGDEVEDLLTQKAAQKAAKTGRLTVPCGGKRASMGDFALLRVIGRGSYGKVIKVRHNKSGKLYAMKVMKKTELIAQNVVDNIKEERDLLASISHPYVVPLAFAFQTKANVYLVMDFLRGGELHVHIARKGRLTMQRAQFYSAQIALALAHLHTNHIVFRDLKPLNIVLDSQGHACLCDFGLARRLDGPDGTTTYQVTSYCGTEDYICPEMIRGDPYSYEADWWSFGVLLFEMLQGVPPWQHDNDARLLDMICEDPIVHPHSIPNTAKDLIENLLRKQKGDRIQTLEAIKTHPFFEGIDWAALEGRKLKPPFVPDIADDDTKYFDKRFTDERVVLSVCKAPDAKQNKNFQGFSFTNTNYLGLSVPSAFDASLEEPLGF